jgi:hypothetical protein
MTDIQLAIALGVTGIAIFVVALLWIYHGQAVLEREERLRRNTKFYLDKENQDDE